MIQEAFKYGRPVICSDIGGMAEKVTPGVNGLHFRAGNALDLADRIEEAVESPGLWERLHIPDRATRYDRRDGRQAARRLPIRGQARRTGRGQYPAGPDRPSCLRGERRS